jgi:hypothetical protein
MTVCIDTFHHKRSMRTTSSFIGLRGLKSSAVYTTGQVIVTSGELEKSADFVVAAR